MSKSGDFCADTEGLLLESTKHKKQLESLPVNFVQTLVGGREREKKKERKGGQSSNNSNWFRTF